MESRGNAVEEVRGRRNLMQEFEETVRVDTLEVIDEVVKGDGVRIDKVVIGDGNKMQDFEHGVYVDAVEVAEDSYPEEVWADGNYDVGKVVKFNGVGADKIFIGDGKILHDFEHAVHVDGNEVAEESDLISTCGHVDVVEELANDGPVRWSSALEVSQLNELCSPRRVLEHWDTAPVRAHNDIGVEGNEAKFLRSKTEKKETPRHELMLDKLSDREKKKLIVNLVKIQNDGTVEVDVARSEPVASELLELDSADAASTDIIDTTFESNKSVPKLRIVMLVVGTRGDVQPFLAMAKRLQEFGHYVRLATHANFRTFVKAAGIDFYPLGGDPRVLAGYMARNKGFLPSSHGEISIQRKQLKAIIESLLPACTEPDLETGIPFRAQAIIANPPSYGHAHVAEALGVPLHIFFTMPWTPTIEFPHPLARVPQSAYRLSYLVVDLMIWWGIRGFINDFRKRRLRLAPIAYFSTYYGSISHLPTGYLWSPQLVPKPSDWGPLVDVVGFCFLNLGAKYNPKEEFLKWIQDGPKPIYVGFGSMPLEDSKRTTNIILEALKDTGQRGILDRGWGDLGILPEVPKDIFLLEDCPHDWLFPQCAAVIHHGGAGTTATGLRAGCPTTIVPFFGDQFFWGERIHQKGLGPAPIPVSELSVENISEAIIFMLQPEVKEQAIELAKKIGNEDGVAAAVDAFHRHLPLGMPLPIETVEEEDHPYLMQRFFLVIGRWCCLPCSSQ